jgi:tetratricopeptide (TPR) repeat protein
MPRTRSPRTEPAPPPGGIAPERWVLAAGALLYAGIVAVTSLKPGPGAWGFNAPGFLPPPLRLLLLAATVAFAVVVAAGALRRARPSPAPRRTRRGRSAWRERGPWLLIPLWLAAAYLLRVAEPLLGDSYVWIMGARSGRIEPSSEPLSAGLLAAFANFLRARGAPIDQHTIGLLMMLLAIPASLLLAALARRISSRTDWAFPFGLLLTLGSAQLYFGYVESYPFAILFLVAYVGLGYRSLKRDTSPALAGVALGMAIAAHLSSIHLLASYLLLVLPRPGRALPRIAALLVPPATAVLLFALLGFAPSRWLHPFEVAAMAAREGTTAAAYLRPYGLVSLRHLADVANAAALAAPVAILLLAAGIARWIRARERPSREFLFLGVAAATGALLVAGLMTPVAPAQDWDLSAMLLLPLAVLGIALASSESADAPRGLARAGLLGLSATALLSFALVNAHSEAAVRRFHAVVSDPRRVSPFGRAYGIGTLEQLFRERGDPERALVYARETLQAEPGNPRYWTNVGNDLLSLHRLEEAETYLKEAVARAPHRWEANYDLGLCYMGMERYADALPRFRAAALGAPNRPEVLHNLGLALYRTGQTEAAIAVWTEVLKRWPDYAASLRPGAGASPPPR